MNLLTSLVFVAFLFLSNQSGSINGYKLSPNHFAFALFRSTATSRRLNVNTTGSVTTNTKLTGTNQIWELLYPLGSDNSSVTYTIRSVLNGKQLSCDATNNLILTSANVNDQRQIWSIVDAGDQNYFIVNNATGYVIESDFLGNAVTKAQQSTFSEFQGWTIAYTEITNTYDILTQTFGVFPLIEPVVFTDANSGQRIDSNYAGNAYYGNPSYSNFQKWTIRQIDSNTVTIQDRETKLSLAPPLSSINCGLLNTYRTVIPNSSDKKQQWTLTLNSDQTFTITNEDNTNCSLPSKWYIDEAYSDITDLLFYSNGPFSLIFDNNNGVLSIDSNGVPVVSTTDTSDNSKWLFLPGEINTATPYFNIQNVGSGKLLDGSSSSLYTLPANGGDYQKWTLLKHQDIYWLKSRGSGKYLGFTGGSSAVPLNFNNASDSTKNWRIEITPSYYSLTASIVDFSYILQNNIFFNKESTVDVLNSETIYNPTNSEITRTYTKTITKESSVTLSFTESINIGAKVTVEAGAVFSKASMEFSMDFGFESTQEKTYVQIEEISFEQDIFVPANTSVNVLATLKTLPNFEIPFTALAYFQLRAFNPTSNDLGESFLSGDSVAGYIRNLGFNGRIISITNNAVYVSLSGTMTGDYGIEGQIIVSNI